MGKNSIIYFALLILLSQSCNENSPISTNHYQELINSIPHDISSKLDWDFLLDRERDIRKIENDVFRLITLEAPRFDKKSFLFQKTQDGGTLTYREVLNLENGKNKKVKFEEVLIFNDTKWKLIESHFDKFEFGTLDLYETNSEEFASLFLLEANMTEIQDGDRIRVGIKSIIRHSTSGSNLAQRIADELTMFYYSNTKRK